MWEKFKNSSNAPIYRPEREKEIIDRLTKISESQNGLLKREDIEAIFLEIFIDYIIFIIKK